MRKTDSRSKNSYKKVVNHVYKNIFWILLEQDKLTKIAGSENQNINA